MAGRFSAWLGGAARRFVGIPWREIQSDAFRRVFFVVKGACFFHVLNAHLFTVAFVYGPSMLPTLNLTGDVVGVERLTNRWRALAVGDVVMLISPENPKKTIAKRVLGLEGDQVTFLVDHPSDGEDTKTVIVPRGHIWVQGDNTYSSRDSRNFGPVPSGLVTGRAFCRVWPPKEVGLIGYKL